MNSNDLSEVPNNQFGVYALIFHTDNGRKIYIGSASRSFRKRLHAHLNLLKNGKHFNAHVQNLYEIYGTPEFYILEISNNPETVTLREQIWINNTTPSQLLNIGLVLPSEMYGRHHSPETKQIMSFIRLGKRHPMFSKHHSLETKMKISAARKGRKFGPHSQETRERISKSNLGRVMSSETKEKLLRSHLGVAQSQETRTKISISLKGNQNTKGKKLSRKKAETING